MGQPVSGIGDSTTGHGCWPPTNICEGASTIIVEGIPPARIGDAAIPHRCTKDPHPTHGLSVASGSSTTIYQGMPVARIGDSMTCGDAIAQGRPSIIIGG